MTIPTPTSDFTLEQLESALAARCAAEIRELRTRRTALAAEIQRLDAEIAACDGPGALPSTAVVRTTPVAPRRRRVIVEAEPAPAAPPEPVAEPPRPIEVPRVRRTASIGSRILQTLASRTPARASTAAILDELRAGIPADNPDAVVLQSLRALRGNGLVETRDGDHFELTAAGLERAQGVAAPSEAGVAGA